MTAIPITAMIVPVPIRAVRPLDVVRPFRRSYKTAKASNKATLFIQSRDGGVIPSNHTRINGTIACSPVLHNSSGRRNPV